MKPLVHQIIIGESLVLENGACKAWGSITLVCGEKNLLVDTGLPSQKELILKSLLSYGISADEIDYVVLTHGHSDHIGNNNLFEKSIFIMDNDVCQGDSYTFHDFSKTCLELFEGVQIMGTPGHTDHDLTVIVRSDLGVYAIAGDIFEKKEDLQEPELWQAWSKQPSLQEKQRARILELADFIVPGHGQLYRTPSSELRQSYFKA